jgi:hypothetical protein
MRACLYIVATIPLLAEGYRTLDETLGQTVLHYELTISLGDCWLALRGLRSTLPLGVTRYSASRGRRARRRRGPVGSCRDGTPRQR